jgi:polyhydroxybutyrate depolymerase
MHDAGGNGLTLESKGVDLGAGAANAVVAYPESPSGTSPADDVPFLEAVLGDVSARVQVDAAHVVVGGLGSGGTLAYRFACGHAELVRGVYVVAGAGAAPSCAPSRPVSLLHIHGSADTTTPYSAAAATVFDWAAASGCGTTFTTSAYNRRTDVNDYRFTACPAGTSVEVLRSKAMGHVWPTTAAETQATGVAPSTMLWSWAATL